MGTATCGVPATAAHSCGRPEVFHLKGDCSALKRRPKEVTGAGGERVRVDFWRPPQVERVYHHKVKKAWGKEDQHFFEL